MLYQLTQKKKLKKKMDLIDKEERIQDLYEDTKYKSEQNTDESYEDWLQSEFGDNADTVYWNNE